MTKRSISFMIFLAAVLLPYTVPSNARIAEPPCNDSDQFRRMKVTSAVRWAEEAMVIRADGTLIVSKGDKAVIIYANRGITARVVPRVVRALKVAGKRAAMRVVEKVKRGISLILTAADKDLPATFAKHSGP